MALTASQRRKLPKAAFVYHQGPRSKWRYPVPTKAQAKAAGISEKSRLAMHRNALARAGQKKTSGSYATVGPKVRARAGGKVASVRKGAKGGATRPASKGRRGR